MALRVVPKEGKREDCSDESAVPVDLLQSKPTLKLDFLRIRARFVRLPVSVRETPVSLGHLIAFTETVLEAMDEILTAIEAGKKSRP